MKDCGKVTYKNPVSAWRANRALSSSKNALQNHRKIYKRCVAYHCDQCHQWHTTRPVRVSAVAGIHATTKASTSNPLPAIRLSITVYRLLSKRINNLLQQSSILGGQGLNSQRHPQDFITDLNNLIICR